MQGFATEIESGEGELVTPTGAAIIAALASSGAPREMATEEIGYGAGERRFRDRPNLLRLLLGESSEGSAKSAMVLIETNIDDLNPEFYDHVISELMNAGAADVYLTAVQMKKNRPGTLLSILCGTGDRAKMSEILFRETSTIGIRYSAVQREELSRRIESVNTAFGTIRVKIAGRDQSQLNIAPEYDDCSRAAAEHGVPVKMVYQAALVAAHRET